MSESDSPYNPELHESDSDTISVLWWEYSKTPGARFNNTKIFLMLDGKPYHEVSMEGLAPWDAAREKTSELLGKEVGIASIDAVRLDSEGFACFVKLKRGAISTLSSEILRKSEVISVDALNIRGYESDPILEKFTTKHTQKH